MIVNICRIIRDFSRWPTVLTLSGTAWGSGTVDGEHKRNLVRVFSNMKRWKRCIRISCTKFWRCILLTLQEVLDLQGCKYSQPNGMPTSQLPWPHSYLGIRYVHEASHRLTSACWLLYKSRAKPHQALQSSQPVCNFVTHIPRLISIRTNVLCSMPCEVGVI